MSMGVPYIGGAPPRDRDEPYVWHPPGLKVRCSRPIIRSIGSAI
jgi:hypothetical protein